MKTRYSFYTLILLALMILPSYPIHALSGRVSEITAEPGAVDVAVSIELAAAAGIAGGSLTLTYDASVLRATRVSAGALAVSGGLTVIDNVATAGEVRISLAGARGLSTASGMLVTVFFDVATEASAGTYALALTSAVFRDESAQLIPVTTTAGSIQVVDGDAGQQIVNGDFENGLTDWEPWERGPFGGSMVGQVSASVVTDGASSVLEVKRTDAGATGADYGIRQDLTWDVSGVASLLIKIDVKVVHQSLSGGGGGTEFPARIIIAYEDADGSAHSWQHGFYYLGNAANAQIPVTKVTQNAWHSYTEDLMLLENKPHTITQITLWGNGWDYTARFDTVHLILQPQIQADAGPDQTVNEGEPVTFDASASVAPAGVVYEWDLDGDGQYDDTTGINPTNTWADNGIFQIGLRLSAGGDFATDTMMVTVLNVAPIAHAGGPYVGDEGTSITLNGSATDAGADPLTYAWDLNGDGQFDDAIGAQPTILLSDTFADVITLRVTDDDGGVGTATDSLTVSKIPSREVTNGDFENGLTDWEPWERGPFGGSMVGQVSASVVTDGASSVLEVKRTDAGATGADYGVRQDLTWDVSGAASLLIKMDVKVVHQSLSGGGGGTEFPARIIIAYEDADGSAHSWQHGFYYDGNAANAQIPVTKVTQNAWHSYTEDLMLLESKPHTITQITLWGNGWDYTARFDNVQLILDADFDEVVAFDFNLADGDQGWREAGGAIPGRVYTLQLPITEAPEINGWSTTIEYDPVQVRYVGGSFQVSDFIPGLLALVDEKEGRVGLGGTVLGTDAKNSGDGVLGTFSFEVLEGFTGSTELIITLVSFRRLDGMEDKREVRSVARITDELALIGDMNGDGMVNFDDFFLFADRFGSSDPQADFNNSGTVDFDDFFLFADHFGQSAGKIVPVQAWPTVNGGLQLTSHFTENNLRVRLRSEDLRLRGYRVVVEYDPAAFRLGGISDTESVLRQGSEALLLTREEGGKILILGSRTGGASGVGGVLAELRFEPLFPEAVGTFRVREATVRQDNGQLVQPRQLGGVEARWLPQVFALHANYPNPFNPETTIRYQLPVESPVRLDIYDMLGRKVRTLVRGVQPAGYHRMAWDSRDRAGKQVAAGVYMYRLQAGEFTQVRKLLLLK